MGNFIAVHVLKQYNPGTFNRGDTGEAKQIIIGGVNRARFSSQCQKRAIRELMACEEIRTAHIEKLIDKCLTKYVEDGIISDEDKDIIGAAICSKKVIGSDCWDKLDEKEKKDKKTKSEENDGRVIVSTNASEITALVTTFVEYYKENGSFDSKEEKVAEAALNDVQTSVAKSFFGTMATSGVLGTIDGAVEMGQAFSVDEYFAEPDNFTVKFVGRSGAPASDPFFGEYESFNKEESSKANSETMNDGLSLYSNVMYSYSNVNLKELERNLNSHIVGNKYVPSETTNDIILKEVPRYVKSMIEMVPEATQRRSSSHVAPCAVLIEIIEGGSNIQPDWNKVIAPTPDFSITEQAVKKLAAFSTDKTFRSGNIKQYVMLSSEYCEFAQNFSDAIQIKNFDELDNVIKEDIKKLI